MTSNTLKLVLVSTPIGHIGSGRGGGVELTITSLIKGLTALGHEVTLVAPEGSEITSNCSQIQVSYVSGKDQESWQHKDYDSDITIPNGGILPKLWERALELGKYADAILNFGYDWLPIWLTERVNLEIYHLISMGNVSAAMHSIVKQISLENQHRLAFHTYRQASDFELNEKPIVVGNGFDLDNYKLQLNKNGSLGWAGRIAPEKGLEDAVKVASALKDKLVVWGLIEDSKYAESIEASVSPGTIDWRGFLPTKQLQKELGACRALINTPKWNEAYGNVVVEAMACGVPVVAYDRGGPGELITSGLTGWLVPPDDINELINATSKVNKIDRRNCRIWVEESASKEKFTNRIVEWISNGIRAKTT